jgi:hypothetical protein
LGSQLAGTIVAQQAVASGYLGSASNSYATPSVTAAHEIDQLAIEVAATGVYAI